MRDPGIIEEGAFLVEDGIITHIGPARRIENLSAARTAEPVEVHGRVVMPGFVDCHTHLIHGARRVDSFAGGPFLTATTIPQPSFWPALRAVRGATARRLTAHARAAIACMVSNGTTTLNIHSGYGLDESSELKLLRIAAALEQEPLSVKPTFHAAHVTPPEFAGCPDSFLDYLLADLLPGVARRRLAAAAAISCDAGAFSVTQARRYLLAARENGLSLTVHASRYANIGAVQLAVDLEARVVSHLESANPAEIACLAASRAIATLIPGAAFHGVLPRPAPARQLIDSGAAVALATGCNPIDSPIYSMPVVLSLACAQLRMTPAEALTAATINAAHALGIAGETGSLESGKHADFLILAASDYRELPFALGADLVAATYRHGLALRSTPPSLSIQ
jgi:imidazolonepropionase